MRVFARTNRHGKGEQYYGTKSMLLSPASADTLAMTSTAKELIKQCYQDGIRFHKCGVILHDLRPANTPQLNLFQSDNITRKHLMACMDNINQDWGASTVRSAAMGFTQGFKLKAENKSPRYTTKIGEVATVWAR